LLGRALGPGFDCGKTPDDIERNPCDRLEGSGFRPARVYSLANFRRPKGTLVVFIRNHCPYVKASINRIVAEATALREIGIGTTAVMPKADISQCNCHIRLYSQKRTWAVQLEMSALGQKRTSSN
jgi:hypothetical protein